MEGGGGGNFFCPTLKNPEYAPGHNLLLIPIRSLGDLHNVGDVIERKKDEYSPWIREAAKKVLSLVAQPLRSFYISRAPVNVRTILNV